MRIFASIIKRDDEKRMVYGYASTEALDSQGERVSKAAMEKALPEYMRFANIREMHQASAVGVAKSAEIDEKGLYLCAKVVDDKAWEKVKEGVYKGFSIGGKMVAKADNIITDLKLTEISLVDRPANPEAVIEVWKADGPDPSDVAAVEELAKIMNGGALKPSELLALAKRAQADKDLALAALPDGSFKIVKAEDVRHALAAFPLAKDAAAAKTHIAARARVLGVEGKIPAAWLVGKVDDAQKGMGTVSWLAGMLDSISSLQCSCDYERAAEGDSSPVPAAIKDWLGSGVKILADMVAEESAELMAVARAEPAGDVSKTAAAAAAAPLTSAPSPPPEGASAATAAAAAPAADVAKFDAELAKRDALIESATKTIEALEKRLKTLEEQPMPAKGPTRAIGKTEDTGVDPAPAIPPVQNADGSIDKVATAIKGIHAAGPTVPVFHRAAL